MERGQQRPNTSQTCICTELEEHSTDIVSGYNDYEVFLEMFLYFSAGLRHIKTMNFWI